MHKSFTVLLGLLVILLPLGTSMNISNANAIADFDKADRKQVSVNSLKCNNINVNVNGLELDVFPPFLANSGLAAEAVDGNTDPSSFAANGDGSEIKDFRYICINNNNNTVIPEESILPTPPTPPEPKKTTLTVIKTVRCEGPPVSIQQAEVPTPIEDCEDLLTAITPANFTIQVTGNGATPANFEGSATGTDVNIGAGHYAVSETSLSTPTGFTLETEFAGDCDADGEGNIVAETDQTCEIINTFKKNATLTVKKTPVCEDPGIDRCILFLIRDIGQPANYNITVTGNGATPANFAGSATGTNVTIGPGPYTITETFPGTPISLNLTTTFSGSCIADPAVPQKATGTIVAGTDQTCEIINTYTPSGFLGVTGAHSSLTAQGTADSPELTTTEKLTKLKTQWLNELP